MKSERAHYPLSMEQSHILETQISNEWRAIINAQGYGKNWLHWVLQFECVQSVTMSIPSYDELHILAQLTKHDCNIECANEVNNRKQFNKRSFQIDFKESSGKMIYRRVKQHQSKTLTSLPAYNHQCTGNTM